MYSMNAPHRLLAIDLDGTLLNTRNELSPGNRAALHRAHEAGLVVCLCTGRSVTESRPVIDQIGLDLNAGVFVFGAIVADLAAGTTLVRNALSPALVDRVVGHLHERGHPILVLYDAAEAGCDYALIEGRRNREAYERWLAFTPTRTEQMTEWRPRTCAPLRVSVIEHPDHVAKTLHDLQAEFDPSRAKINSIYAPNYGLHVVECFAPEVNKWHGITQLAERLGILRPQIAAIGDDVNDIEMIAQAGLGVAMGNAIPAIRQASRLYAPTNDQDGVAWLVDKILGGQVSGPIRSS